ncbi:hypothetical protein GHT06_018660 [Daphnia sinensis]|uniref:HAT C-terminal dimerisation domain-containing protein n=1 Tax=Daphnia sinensis TaxID=1820382 RepID=A0AAD5L5H6_9CRUS|nr:hypothetical protein GHT06_018660 [Daphnia sinensis]
MDIAPPLVDLYARFSAPGGGKTEKLIKVAAEAALRQWGRAFLHRPRQHTRRVMVERPTFVPSRTHRPALGAARGRGRGRSAQGGQLEFFLHKILTTVLLCKILFCEACGKNNLPSVRRSANDTEIVYKATKLHHPAKNVTRWNSQYYSIKSFLRILEIDPLIQTKLNATKEKSNRLTNTMIGILMELVLILEPFQEATDELQADYETLGNTEPLITIMSFGWQNFSLCRSGGCLKKSLKSRMPYVLQDTYYVLGAVLDPRFKKCWIAATSMSEHALLNSVRFELTSRYSKLKDDESEFHDPTQSKKKRNLYSTINTSKRTPSAGSAKILDELEVYLSEPNIPMEKLDDSGILQPTRALKYWKLHSHRSLFLSFVAKDIYGCPASSAGIEKAFSTTSDILTAKRARTKSYLFQQLLFLKPNSELFDC